MDRPWRVVLDPNVLVSAVITPSGATGQIVTLIDTGTLVPILSPALVAELTAVLRRPKFRRYLDINTVMAFVVALETQAEFVSDPENPPAVSVDPADDYLVALVRITGADALVSGDPDLLTLTVDDVVVLSPRQLITLVAS